MTVKEKIISDKNNQQFIIQVFQEDNEHRMYVISHDHKIMEVGYILSAHDQDLLNSDTRTKEQDEYIARVQTISPQESDIKPGCVIYPRTSKTDLTCSVDGKTHLRIIEVSKVKDLTDENHFVFKHSVPQQLFHVKVKNGFFGKWYYVLVTNGLLSSIFINGNSHPIIQVMGKDRKLEDLLSGRGRPILYLGKDLDPESPDQTREIIKIKMIY